MNMENRLRRLERQIKAVSISPGFCMCRVKKYFFRVRGYTREQNRELIAGNVEYCNICKKKNPVIDLDSPKVLQER